MHLVCISYNRDHYSLGRSTQHKIKENLVAFFQNLSATEKINPGQIFLTKYPSTKLNVFNFVKGTEMGSFLYIHSPKNFI